MGEVIILDTLTRLDVPPDRVLQGAIGEVDTAIVIGKDKDGAPYYASSLTDRKEILWELERFKLFLMELD